MAQVKITTSLTIDDTSSGNNIVNTTATVQYTTKEDKEYTVAATSNQIVWDPTTDGSEALTSFDFLYILSDGNCDVEFVTDVGDDVGNEAGTVRVTSQVPLILGADDSYANVTGVDALGGTLDVIDKIRVRNPGASSITVRVFLGKT